MGRTFQGRESLAKRVAKVAVPLLGVGMGLDGIFNNFDITDATLGELIRKIFGDFG